MIRIGTCSWKYNSWKGIIYPQKEKFNYLTEYSKHFNTVEIDQWFWSLHSLDKVGLPKGKDVKDYSQSVPDDFRFTIKIPNSITLTHFYQKKKSDPLIINPHFLNADLFESFIQSLKAMNSKIGVLMFQFEYLNKQKMSSQMQFIEMFESFLEKIDRQFILGIEIRNPNYLNKKYFEFLRRNKLSMVFLQGYYMPPVWEVFNSHKEFVERTSVIRLHGPDRKGIEEKTGGVWNRIIEPRDEELHSIADIAQYLESIETDTYINVNNHFEGSAPLTIKKVKKILNKKN